MHVQLSENFKDFEFFVSELFPSLAQQIYEECSPLDILKLRIITNTILQPVRSHFGPVIITSGKRNQQLNALVKGEPNSDHLFNNSSCATDFTLQDGNVNAAFGWIKEKLPYSFGQLIYYPSKNFIHVSLPTTKHRWESFVK